MIQKTIAVVLLLCLLLSGCGTADHNASGTAPAGLPADTVPVAVRMEHLSNDGYDGEELVLTFLYDVTTVTIPGREKAAESINSFLRQEEKRFLEGDPKSQDSVGLMGYGALLDQALQFREEAGDQFTPYFAMRTVTVTQAGDTMLNLAVEGSTYSGGAHGSNWAEYLVFSTESGKRLHLEDLTRDPKGFREFLVEWMVKKANASEPIRSRIAWFGPDEYAENFETLLRDGSWHFEENELVINSQDYEFGPYAAGRVEFRIPLPLLQDWLKPGFLPEQHTGSGTLELQGPDAQPDLVLDQVTHETESSVLYLTADGTVWDVELLKTELVEDRFIEGDRLWYCSEMKDCSLMIETWLPDAAPNLMVRWRSGDGQVHSGLLTQSGKDGHYFLMDPMQE